MCIKAETARKVARGSVEFLKKKEIFDLSTINALINSKMAQGEFRVIYTLYAGKLSHNDYGTYKSGVISSLKKAGYKLLNVKHPNKSLFILHICWEGEFELPEDI